MKKFNFVVFTNAVAGREKEYNDWYSEQHLPDVLRVPGFTSAQRFALAPVQRMDPPYPYQVMAVYEMETDDARGVLDELNRRIGTADMPVSTAMAEVHASYLYQAVTPKKQRLEA